VAQSTDIAKISAYNIPLNIKNIEHKYINIGICVLFDLNKECIFIRKKHTAKKLCAYG
jgi:hypothetical protein